MKFGEIEASIPQEIIFEIFSWLPAKSLMRFKCVSRLSNSIVFELDFVDIHSCRSMTRSGGTKFFLHERNAFYTAEQKEHGNIFASLFQAERFDRLYSCSNSLLDLVNGLFCIWGPSFMRCAAIFNPSTREVRLLPDPNKDISWHKYSLGFEPEEKKYKVFLSATLQGYKKQWVLTLGINESWRETQSIPPSTPHSMRSVCISGVIYQFVINQEHVIAAIDVKSENFKIITLWNASHWVVTYELLEVNGKLGVIDYGSWVDGFFDLWIFKKTPEKEWHRHMIRFPSIWKNVVSRPISSYMSRDGEIVFVLNFYSGALCSCYDVNTKMWRELGISGLPEKTNIKGIYSYVERIVTYDRKHDSL